MATTGFWPIKGNLKAAIEYAENPDKTTGGSFLETDLAKALKYAENGEKTDQCVFVTGINCSRHFAYEEMIAVKRRFGERGCNIAYHGYQSFRAGEVTPEEAFEIGKETARRMWGDRYQVVVTTHLNTDNLHNHFVVNSVSFKDGTKFRDKIGDHLELRRISDEICRERGLSVLENSEFYKKGKKDYWVHKSGKKTHADLVRADVEYCLKNSYSYEEFRKQLKGLGYELDETRMSVRAKSWERFKRLSTLGYTEEVIKERIRKNYEMTDEEWAAIDYTPPYKPKSFILYSLLKQNGFRLEYARSAETIFVDLVLEILLGALFLAAEAKIMLLSPDLRHAAKDLKQFVSDFNYLKSENIHTLQELDSDISRISESISSLESERNRVSNKIRRCKSPEKVIEYKEQRKKISREIKPLRQKKKRAERIRKDSPHLYDLLEQEYRIERKEIQRIRERTR